MQLKGWSKTKWRSEIGVQEKNHTGNDRALLTSQIKNKRWEFLEEDRALLIKKQSERSELSKPSLTTHH